jgi:arginine decarboxylase
MNTKYSDLINQTYYFPQDEFTLNKDNLKFHNVDLMKLVEEYGTPLIHLFTSNFKHQQGQNWFRKSMEKINMRQNIITAIVQRAPI